MRSFVLILSVLCISCFSEPSCSAHSKATWIGQPSFTVNYKKCCVKASIIESGFHSCLRNAIKKASGGTILEDSCIDCFKQAFRCVMRSCKSYCLIDAASAACMECTDQECNPGLMSCTGATSRAELPLPPSRG